MGTDFPPAGVDGAGVPEAFITPLRVVVLTGISGVEAFITPLRVVVFVLPAKTQRGNTNRKPSVITKVMFCFIFLLI